MKLQTMTQIQIHLQMKLQTMTQIQIHLQIRLQIHKDRYIPRGCGRLKDRVYILQGNIYAQDRD